MCPKKLEALGLVAGAGTDHPGVTSNFGQWHSSGTQPLADSDPSEVIPGELSSTAGTSLRRGEQLLSLIKAKGVDAQASTRTDLANSEEASSR